MNKVYVLINFPAFSNSIEQVNVVYVSSDRELVENGQKTMLDQGVYSQGELRIIEVFAHI